MYLKMISIPVFLLAFAMCAQVPPKTLALMRKSLSSRIAVPTRRCGNKDERHQVDQDPQADQWYAYKGE